MIARRLFLCLAILLAVGFAPPAWADGTAAATNQSAAPTVKVAGIVLKWIKQDKDANLRRAEPLIRQAAAGGAKIVSTTECFLDGYSIADKTIPIDEYRALGEQIPDGPYFKKLAALADELDIHLIAGLLEAEGQSLFNTAAMIGPDGKLVGKYHKQKLLHESVRNTAGKESPVFATPFGKISVMICSDRTDPRIAERLCTAGADFLVCPSGGMSGPIDNDPILQRRSRENEVFIVFVHPIEFLVTDPEGDIREVKMLGDRLWIDPAEAGGEHDESAVYYFDVPGKRVLSPES